MGILGWAAVVVGVLVGLLVLITLVGSFFPRSRVAARTLKSGCPPELLWQIITDFAAVPKWHAQVRRVERLCDRDGHEVWREIHKGGAPLQLESVECVPYRRLVRRIVDEKKVFSGRWEYDLAPDGSGSRLTVTEHGEVGNPFFRFLWTVMMNPTMYIDLYLTALAKKLGEDAVLESCS